MIREACVDRVHAPLRAECAVNKIHYLAMNNLTEESSPAAAILTETTTRFVRHVSRTP
jgi:hypothetical protein